MGETVVILIITGLICAAVCVCFMGFFLIRKSSEVAQKKAELEKDILIEREKNERILAVEELKNERSRLSNEKTAIYANRDMVAAQLEAGVLGQQQEEEGGIEGLIKNIAPLLLQNPDILKNLNLGNLFTKNNQVPVQAPVPSGGGAVNPSPASFPVSGSGEGAAE
ncbi:MAG TPA: hypothetical protein O0X39_04195 [Methanocorpusculum sp.]|nr:hypothetical protein [Methanocorpusculum sp.]